MRLREALPSSPRSISSYQASVEVRVQAADDVELGDVVAALLGRVRVDLLVRSSAQACGSSFSAAKLQNLQL